MPPESHESLIEGPGIAMATSPGKLAKERTRGSGSAIVQAGIAMSVVQRLFMRVLKSLLMRAFGRPKGVLGRLGGIIMARGNKRMAGQAVELLDVQPNDAVLEIGFGPGVGIQLLASLVASGRVAGVDPSEEMMQQATLRNAGAIETGKVELRRSSVERLPFESDAFDKALAINSMQVWPDAVAGLRETRRVMKSGGRVVLGFTRHSGQPKEGLAKALRTAGFAHARVLDMGKDFCALAIKP
jgi:SAM-dependent methyltransferase